MWILSHHGTELSSEKEIDGLLKLKKFHAKQTLAHATLFFMAANLATTAEIEEMR